MSHTKVWRPRTEHRELKTPGGETHNLRLMERCNFSENLAHCRERPSALAGPCAPWPEWKPRAGSVLGEVRVFREQDVCKAARELGLHTREGARSSCPMGSGPRGLSPASGLRGSDHRSLDNDSMRSPSTVQSETLPLPP